jgi:hypothetical protein
VVGAPRFELGTPSPPDWCANRAALRSASGATSTLAPLAAQGCVGQPSGTACARGKSGEATAFRRRLDYAASGRDIQRTSGIAGSSQASPATT